MHEAIRAYLAAHPLMEPRDLIKFCYQSVLGPGHAAPDRASARAWAEEEYRAVGPRSGEPAVTPLAGNAARADLDCGISPAHLADLFCLTAEQWQGGSPDDVEALLRDETLTLPFPRQALDEALNEWIEAGRPAVHHSETYKRHYRAAYRVIDSRFVPFLPAIAAVEHLKTPAVVAVDGMCGCGKSTLGAVLSYVFDAPLIHMDDFYVPLEMKTPARFAEPGGNVHYERFSKEVAPFVGGPSPFTFGLYECGVWAITSHQTVQPAPFTVVEGSYSFNPKNGVDYDLRLFVESDRETQLARLLAREGPARLEDFKSKWIPLEELYFDNMDVRSMADLIVRT